MFTVVRSIRQIHPASSVVARAFSNKPSTNNSPGKQNDEERARLKKELGRMILGGGLYDIRTAAKDEDSKVFQTEIVSTDRAQVIPRSLSELSAISGKKISLLNNNNNNTALLIAFNQLGWTMLEDWRNMFLASTVKPNFNIIQVSVVEGRTAGWFSGYLAEALKRSTPTELHDKVVLWTGSFQAERDFLGIDNRAVGYSFVLDTHGRVRVKGSGKCIKNDRAVLYEYLSTARS